MYCFNLSLNSLFLSWKVNFKTAFIFLQQLTILMQAELPIIQSLTIIQKQAKNTQLYFLAEFCKRNLTAGSNLSDTLTKIGDPFSPLIINLIRIGEESGMLNNLLNEALNYFKLIDARKKQCQKALRYPIFLLIFGLIITLCFFKIIFPPLEQLFYDTNAPLPSYTQHLLHFGNLLAKFWPLFLVIFILVYLFFKLLRRFPSFNWLLNWVLFHTPYINKIIFTYDEGLFAYSLALLLKAGLPLFKALQIVSGHFTKQPILSLACQQLIITVRNGKTLAEAMNNLPCHQLTTEQLIALGEESGKLEEILQQLATIRNQQLNELLNSLYAILEPTAIIIIGILIGATIFALYLPIFNLGNLI